MAFGSVKIGDWYLPSEYELRLLMFQRDIIGGFNNPNTGYYWSSTEIDDDEAFANMGGSSVRLPKYTPCKVRAIRAF